VDGRETVIVPGDTVGEVLAALAAERPDIAGAVWADRRRLAPGLAVFLGRANIRSLRGLETRVGEDADLFLVAPLLVGR